MMLERMILLNEKPEFFVEVFQPQHGANTLIEWVFVNDQSSVPRSWAEKNVCDSDRSQGKIQTSMLN
jgi:hypothetical protein